MQLKKFIFYLIFISLSYSSMGMGFSATYTKIDSLSDKNINARIYLDLKTKEFEFLYNGKKVPLKQDYNSNIHAKYYDKHGF